MTTAHKVKKVGEMLKLVGCEDDTMDPATFRRAFETVLRRYENTFKTVPSSMAFYPAF